MDQVTTGLRSVLSAPWAYDFLQSAFGDRRARRRIADEHIRARESDVMVDVGCGTAQLLRYLPENMQYFGFDLSNAYITAAKNRFASRKNAHFECADINTLSHEAIPSCDLAIVYGVLHHINDVTAAALLDGLSLRLKPGGRLIAIDPVLVGGQHAFARKLIEMDRGQHVRSPDGYLTLPGDSYQQKTVTIHHDLFYIPYSHAVLECTK